MSDYSGNWPYDSTDNKGLKYSTVALTISLVVSAAIALGPLILGAMKLPCGTVISGNNSAVISAACHCVLRSQNSVTCEPKVLQTNDNNNATPVTKVPSEATLYAIATGKVRWGAVLDEYSDEHGQRVPGHLAFGSPEHNVQDVVEGRTYAGLQRKGSNVSPHRNLAL
jgi:hypothetical protein